MKVRKMSPREQDRIDASLENVGDMVVSMDTLMSSPEIINYKKLDILKELGVNAREETLLDRHKKRRKINVVKTERYIKRKF